MNSALSDRLLNWYEQNARSLPWRNNPHPYHVWISEIMLQQTKVETVIPFFERWIERFPDISSLARANQSEVLQLWEGLGYYARARNLHRAAQLIVNLYNGELPQDPKILRSLPGIGAYTANAIASIAYQQNVATLDGNIMRVIARLMALNLPVKSKIAGQKIYEFAIELLPKGQAGQFNQALMELGALICTPHKPDCIRCPLMNDCQTYKNGLQEQIPLKIPKKLTPHITVAAGVVWQNKRVLIAQRPQKGLLGGLWEFPGGKVEQGESLQGCLLRELREELDLPVNVDQKIGIYHHAYTHFKVTLHAFHCHPFPGSFPKPQNHQALYWAELPELVNFPMGKIDRNIAQTLTKEILC